MSLVDNDDIIQVIDSLGAWYAIRLSSFESLTLEKTEEMFKDYRYVISEEGDGITVKYHQHIILDAGKLTTEDIRKIVKEQYPDCQGNKCIYIRACKDKKQLMKYTLKDGKYVYKGFSPKFIENHFKCSSAKTDLKKDVKDNEDNFILGKIEFNAFIDKYLEIKVAHDQPLYMNHIKAYCLKMYVKSNPQHRSKLSKEIRDSILGWSEI